MKYALLELDTRNIDHEVPTHVMVRMDTADVAKIDTLINILGEKSSSGSIPEVKTVEIDNSFSYALLEENCDGSYALTTDEDYEWIYDSLIRIHGNECWFVIQAEGESEECFGKFPNSNSWFELTKDQNKELNGLSKSLVLDQAA